MLNTVFVKPEMSSSIWFYVMVPTPQMCQLSPLNTYQRQCQSQACHFSHVCNHHTNYKLDQKGTYRIGILKLVQEW